MNNSKDNSIERVALELAEHIQSSEKSNETLSTKVKPDEAREYWFTLYYQSLRIVKGEFVGRVLPSKKGTENSEKTDS